MDTKFGTFNKQHQMAVYTPRLLETLPQNTVLSTNPKLLYHDP